MRLCDELGVRPEVDRCVECARLLEPDDAVRWIPLLGGALCGSHGGPSHAAAGLSTPRVRGPGTTITAAKIATCATTAPATARSAIRVSRGWAIRSEVPRIPPPFNG